MAGPPPPPKRTGRRFDPGAVVFVAAMLLLGLAAGAFVLRQRPAPSPAGAGPRRHYLDSPYQAQLFHRGQLHVQSNRGIGHALPRDLARAYQRLGYEWIAVTDVNTLTPLDQFNTPGMVGVAGTEAAFPFGHLLDYGVDLIPVTNSLQQNLDYVRGQAGLAILAHPNVAPAVSTGQAAALSGLDAIEVFDARVAREQPNLADATAFWDTLLSAGHRIYGVAGDDSIEQVGAASTVGTTWVDVQAADLGEPLILDAVRRGAFITGTGVRVLGVDTASGDSIRVISTDAASISWYGRGGRLLATTTGAVGTYQVHWDEGYVRAVASRADGARAWTQPVFVVP